MNPQDDKTLAKIRAILAKAEDPAASEAEAEAYFAKAAALMAKYGIERAMLAAYNPGTDEIGDRVITIEGSYVKERQILAAAIAGALGMSSIMRTRERGYGKRKVYEVHLYGYGSDLERAELLYTSLSLQASNGLRNARPGYWDGTLATYRKSWFRGFTAAVSDRIAKAEKRASDEAEELHGSSVALVLADRKALVEQRMYAEHSDLRKWKGRQLSGGGTRAGLEAGRRADIGHTRLTPTRRALSA
ncbi:DUF2786 domain-containing protein [Streptomyces griseoincarnatus]